ncbi:MAG: head GIN domain-containing protein [Chitinophagales bacterium]
MRKVLLLMAFASVHLLANAQDKKVINDANAQTRNVTGFHAINISGGIDLYLAQGSEAVAVSASKTEYRDKIRTVVENGVLKIYLERDGAPWNWNWHNPKLKAYVSFSSLEDLKASGGSDIYLQGSIKVEKLHVNISGGSDLHGRVDIRDLSIHQSGGSDADISGSATNLTVDASGGSDLKGYDLVTENCQIQASGGSDAQITVNKELNANASGGSDIYYRGNGVIREVKSSGSSSVTKKG